MMQLGLFSPQHLRMALVLAVAGMLVPGLAIAQTQRTTLTPSPPGAEVYFVDLNDGATVPSKLKLYFGLRNMGVAPAGSDRQNSGHHHLLIDTTLPPLNRPIPNDPEHQHFGAGQTEAEITLKPGRHSLQLLLGDKDHIPHMPPVMSPRRWVTVPEGPPGEGLTGGPTPSPQGAEVYFTDLKDGAVVSPGQTIHFGLKNMGVAPAGSDRQNSGHHHLLVDTELPPLDQPIPNDPEHLHFGAGQTETKLPDLSPGEHTLQLLLGDKDHIPHTPPIMSRPIKVTVLHPSKRRPAPSDARVYFVGIEDGATVPPQVTLHFGLENMGVAPAGLDKTNTGHHHLLIDTKLPPLDQPIPNDFNHQHFGAGQTEATITLTPGKHTLQLLLGDADHVPHNPPVMSKPITVTVTRTGR
jgi:Domain of unknown function (DUF4399)